jgi:hypothetical protein
MSVDMIYISLSLTRYINTDAVMDRLNFGIELGYFLTSLQKERDMSSLYASRIGTDTKRDLLHNNNHHFRHLLSLSNNSDWVTYK